MAGNYVLTPVAESGCAACPLLGNHYVKQQVPSEVHPIAMPPADLGIDVLFIGEAPGTYENQSGRPMSGGSAKILRQIATKLNGGTETGLAYSNVVRCRTADANDPRRDRETNARERAACKQHILADIMRIKPKRIVLLGRAATMALAQGITDGLETKINKLRGRWFSVPTPDGNVYKALATYNFGFIARHWIIFF